MLNQHFTSTSQRLLQTRASSLDSILQFIDSLPDSQRADEFEPRPVCYREVLKSLASMRLDCSTGADQIPAKYLKLSAEYITLPLTHTINCYISSHSFPKAWKNVRVSPIPKVDAVEADDYRPIAILPCLSKVYERLVLSQLVTYIERLQVYSNNIAGYHKGHCTTTVLMQIRDDIINAMKESEVTLIAFADFSKAFDTVDYSVIIRKLHNIGFSKQVLR